MTETKKNLTQAKEAIEEAEKRRADKSSNQKKQPVELNGRGGLEPTRYGDWEIKGITSDF